MSWEQIQTFFSSLTLERLVPAVIILIVGILLIKALLALFTRALEHSKLEKSLHAILRSIVQILLWAVLAIIVASALGVNVTSLVAMLSVVSLAVSLAVQGTLSNFAGGIQVLSAHPFKVGDFVEIGSVSGTVAEIGLVYTKITTGDNREIYIPNSDVSTSKIINYTSCETRRVDLKLSASYDASPAEVRAALLDAAASCPYVLHEPDAVVRVSEYGESAISYTLQAWTQTEHYWDVYYTVFERIKAAFDERGIEMTYPHLNVHILQ